MSKAVETPGWQVYLYELIEVCMENQEVYLSEEGIHLLLKAIEKDIATAEEELMCCISEEIIKMPSLHPSTVLNKEVTND